MYFIKLSILKFKIKKMINKKVKKINKTERIHIRCTPKQKKIYMNYGGSAFFIKMLEQVDKELLKSLK